MRTALALLLLIAPAAHAEPMFSFGSPEPLGGGVWAVPVMVSGLPDTCDTIGGDDPNFTMLTFTGTLKPMLTFGEPESFIPGDYWPSTGGSLQYWQGLYWWGIGSDEMNCQGGPGQGWVGSFKVTGTGSMAFAEGNQAWHGCGQNFRYPALSGPAVQVPPQPTPTRPTSWGRVKRLFR